MQPKETRMTVADIDRLKAMFADDDDNLKVLRKVFFPEKDDMNPIGMNFDMWSKLDLSGLSPDQALIVVQANKMLVEHVEQCLRMIKTLAGTKQETAEETLKRLTKDSAK